MISKSKPSYGIENENFDLYVQSQLVELTEYEKKLLPIGLLLKIFRNGTKFNPKNSNKLTFFERIYALWKAKGKRIYIVVEDEENGLSIDEFKKHRDEIKKKRKDLTENPFERLKAENSFVLGTKELCDTFSYVNKLSTAPYFNYLIKLKNAPKSKIGNHKAEMNYIVKFLWHFESIKKKMNNQTGINMPEFLVLMYLYNGETVVSSYIHKNVFIHSYQSSRTKIKIAFSSLQQQGLIVKTGMFNNMKLTITELGKEKVNDMMSKYLVDF